ncbi:hypothetical protein K523DRAFT_119249 [Schizophyllum commune Tattone D]|nr:hypothetical protein K523DRAFT_119249 [Schizophyllum commune Tattone D]
MESYDIPRNRRRSTSIRPPSSGAVYKRCIPSRRPECRCDSSVALGGFTRQTGENLMVTPSSVGECCFLLLRSSHTIADPSQLPIRLLTTFDDGLVCWLVRYHSPVHSCRRESSEFRVALAMRIISQQISTPGHRGRLLCYVE